MLLLQEKARGQKLKIKKSNSYRSDCPYPGPKDTKDTSEGFTMTQRSRINWALIGVLVFSLLFSSSAISFADTDLTDKVQLVKSRLRYDPIALLSHLDVSLKNISQDVLSTPIKVVIESISDSSVTVANGDGTTDVGKPYFEYVTDSGVLSPDQTTDSKRWVFSNPDRKRFRYTISVTAKLPGPAVTISADPDTIEVGESSTLIWSSTNTDSCVIAPGIGTVDVDGSITVSPADNTMYTITATGPGGTAVATVTVNVTPAPLSITITSPTDATEFTQAPITVTGRVSRPGATVLVNGIEASVVDNEFMAEDVPLTVGSNAITAVVEEGTDYGSRDHHRLSHEYRSGAVSG